MKAVVTGGAGFVGSNIAKALVDEGHEVHVLDDLSLGTRANVPDDAHFQEGSILDRNLLENLFDETRFVFHQAALPSVPRSIENPIASHRVNTTGTVKVLEAARTAGVEKVVYAASSSAYGDTDKLPKATTDPSNPRSPYAVSKHVGELYCRVFHEIYGLRTTALRYFNVYGPRQDPEGEYAAVIPKFVTAALNDQPLTVHGDGTQTRDFTYVDDVIQANTKAARSKQADGQTLNVGAGERTSIIDLAETILEITGSGTEIVHDDRRPGDVDDSLAEIKPTRETIGYEPQVDLEEGLRRTVEWFQGPGRERFATAH